MHFINVIICGKDDHKFFVLKGGFCVPSPNTYMYIMTTCPIASDNRMICQYPGLRL